MRTGGFDMRGSVEAVAAVARDVATSSPSKNTASAALDMMRYQQRISPDCLPLANGSGSSSSGSSRKLPTPAPRSSADVHDAHPAVAPADSSRGPAPSYLVTASLEQHKPRARVPHHPAPASSSAAFVIRSPARGHHQPSDFADQAAPNPSAAPDGGSSVRLQWGHNKRSRGRRDSPAPPAPAPAPAPAAAETPAQARRRASIKIQRRAAAASASASAQAPAEKLMPPPSTTRGGPSSRASSYLPPRAAAVAAADALYGRTAVALQHHRSAEEPQPSPARQQQRPHRQATEKEKGKGPAVPEPPPKPKQKQKQPAELQKLAAAAPRPEVPRIFMSLSRKEKEEDFLAMKGTKLPQRPKKRPKAVEKAVSMICPGQWLSEVSRSRYMVREKKSKKQKRGGGLKAMDSDTD